MFINSLNITMHIFCMVLLITLIISQMMRKMKDLQNRLFLKLLFIMSASILADIGASFAQISGAYHALTYVLETLAVMLNGAVYPVLFLYLLIDESHESEPFHKAARLIRTVCLLSVFFVLLYLLSPLWNHIFILEQSYGYLIYSKLFNLISHVMLAVFAGKKGRYLAHQKAVFSYGVLMSVSSVIDILFPKFDFDCAVSVIIVLIIYLNFQLEAEKRMESSELNLLNSRISLILGKIRPDLVFSVLKEIEKLCREDTEKAQEAIALLSDFLRGNIDRIDTNDMIPFDDELDHVQKYADLLRLTDISFNVRYDLRYKGFFVPVRTVLPLVEEFAEGGIADQREKTTVLIRSERVGSVCLVDVSGPARIHSHNIEYAKNHYEMISARLSQFEGTSLRLYCTIDGELHALVCYPLKKEVRDDE